MGFWPRFHASCSRGQCSLQPWAPISRLSSHFQGYEGLVEGGENIKQANWLSVSNIIQLVSLGPSLL